MQPKNKSKTPPPVVMKTYLTGNFVIRFLLRRLLKKIAVLLERAGAFGLPGLDVGCGSGHMINFLFQRNAVSQLIAVDLDKNRLSFAKHHFPVCDYLNMDVTALAFAKDTFEFVLAAEILEHLFEPDVAVKEMKRVSKQNTYLIISVPHEPFFRWSNLLRGKYWHRGGRTPTHVNFWTRPEFKRFLKRFFYIEAEYCWSVFPWMLFMVRPK